MGKILPMLRRKRPRRLKKELMVKKKKVKKVIPSWATISVEARSKMSKSSLAKPKIQDAIISAIKLCADGKGVASASAIKSMIMSENPDCPKMVLRKGVAKAIERGLVK